MIYVKSVLVGLLALVVIPICLLVILMVAMVIYALASGEGAIGWDPIRLYPMNPVAWFIPVLIFLAGFIWEYRRLAK